MFYNMRITYVLTAVNPRKKQFVDSELSRGRGSKFPTRGSNRMLVF